MPLFRYKALNARGEMLDGQMEAASNAEVVLRLQEQGHLPVEAKLASEAGGDAPWRALFQPKPFAAAQKVAVQPVAGQRDAVEAGDFRPEAVAAWQILDQRCRPHGFAAGIDVVATDHAPHAREDKDCEWAAGAFGMLGLETALALALTEATFAERAFFCNSGAEANEGDRQKSNQCQYIAHGQPSW